MATLNDLRTKGAVVLSIIIGIAMLAFILGDFVDSGSLLINRHKYRVGVVNGNTISYNQYVEKTNYYTNIYQVLMQTSSLSQQQYEMVYNAAWMDIMMADSYMPSFKRLGMNVSEGEQADMLNGVYVSPIITSFFGNPQTGAYDPESLKSFLASLEYSGDYTMWNYIKEQMTTERLMNNYTSLVKQGFVVNNLEVEMGVRNTNRTTSAKVVAKTYASIADSLVNGAVNSAMVKKYYNEHKEMFKQGISRDIEYVVFDMFPSQSDFDEASKAVKELAAEFAAAESPMQYAVANSQTKPVERWQKQSEMSAELAAIAFGENKGEVYGPVLNGDIYTVSRLAETRSMPDTLGARHILLEATQTERADSIVKALKGGADFATLSHQYSLDTAADAQGGDLGVFAPERMVAEFSEACIKANKGDIFTVETQFGLHVVQLTEKTKPVEKAMIATITYQVDPSETTRNSVITAANDFIAAADGTSEGFNKAVNDLSLSKRTARIRNTDRTINGLESPRELIHWAYDNKKGAVSSTLEIDNNLIIATLTDVKDDGYVSVSDAANDIVRTLVQQEKVKYVANMIAGATSIDQVAEKLGVEVQDVENVGFNAYYVPGVGMEPKLIGAISNSPENTLSKAIGGSGSIFVYDVTAVATATDATAESEEVRLQANAQSYVSERLSQALVEESEVKDYRVKFF